MQIKTTDISKRRQVIFVLFSLLIGISITLVICEIALRVLGIGYGNAPYVSHPILHHVHPKNYTFLSHSLHGEYGGHYVYYDGEGNVEDPTNSEGSISSTEAKYRIAFMGDSFVEAIQVGFSDSFVGILRSRSKHHAIIKNYGTSGYSPVLYALQWEEKVRHFKPTHVFLLLYSNDVDDDYSWAKHGLYSEAGELLAVPGPGGGWVTSQLRKSYVMRFVRKIQLQLKWMMERSSDEPDQVVGGYVETNPELSSLTSSLVLRLARAVEKKGAKFILMAVPSKYRLQGSAGYDPSVPEFSERLKIWAEKNSVEFLDLLGGFQEAAKEGQRLFFEDDIHFNEAGCRVVAERISYRFPNIFNVARDEKK